MRNDCAHLDVALVYKVSAGGKRRYHYQCLDCDQRVGDVVRQADLSQAEMQGAPQFDEVGRRADYSREQRKLREEHGARQRAWWEKYNAYLLSPEWQARRQLVLRRAARVFRRDAQGDIICEGCGLNPAAHVHHLTYEHVFEEFLWELQAVCKACHERLHEKKLDEPGDDF